MKLIRRNGYISLDWVFAFSFGDDALSSEYFDFPESLKSGLDFASADLVSNFVYSVIRRIYNEESI